MGSLVSAVIGDQSGDNAPLVQGRTYSCSVTAKNEAGLGEAALSGRFGTYVKF